MCLNPYGWDEDPVESPSATHNTVDSRSIQDDLDMESFSYRMSAPV